MSTWAEYEKARDAHEAAVQSFWYKRRGGDFADYDRLVKPSREALDAIVRAMAEDGERIERLAAKRRVTAGFPTDIGTLRWHDTDGPLRDAIDAVLPLVPRTQEASNAE